MLTLRVPAKVNLSLDVLGRRPDGYHEIRSVVQTVSLCDQLRLTVAPRLSIDSPIAPPRTDLAWRAALALQQWSGVGVGAHIQLRKLIPVGAGLGGGSADAAAVLVGLSELWQLGLEAAELMAIGAELGSDVPFLLRGGTALIEGRGERVTWISDPGRCWFVLIMPALSLTTRSVYERALPGGGERTSRLLAAMEEGAWNPTGNDLTRAACQVEPRLADLIDRLASHLGTSPQLTGSGSAMFVRVPSLEEGQRLAGRLPAGLFVRVVETVKENSWGRANATADRGRDRGAH